MRLLLPRSLGAPQASAFAQDVFIPVILKCDVQPMPGSPDPNVKTMVKGEGRWL